MRSSDHSDIVKLFEMTDKPKVRFAPKTDKEGFKVIAKYALEKSFADFNFRTLKRSAKFTAEYKKYEQEVKEKRAAQPRGKKDKEARVSDLLLPRFEKEFVYRFHNYFVSSPFEKAEDFDVWHHTTCEMFMDIMNSEGEYENKYTKAYDSLKYGKAQKIVNMMFKHFYCIDGAYDYKEHFKYCHMVLDNYTLEWFDTRNIGKRIDSWSNIVYAEPSVNKNDYMYYQSKIRDYFDSVNNETYRDVANEALTPFKAEFYIWPEMQWEMSARGVTAQNILKEMNNVGHIIANDREIVKLCDDIINYATKLKEYYR